MSINKIIKERRSVRKYTDEDVSKEDVEKLIDAAIWAPSGGNLQPWVIRAVKGEKAEKINRFSPGIYGDPPVIIVICIDRKKFEEKGGKEIISYMDVAIAGENICLQATELGLGTCLIRSFNQKAVGRIIGLEDKYVPELVITVGHPEEIPKAPKRRDREEVVRWVGDW